MLKEEIKGTKKILFLELHATKITSFTILYNFILLLAPGFVVFCYVLSTFFNKTLIIVGQVKHKTMTTLKSREGY